MLPKDEYISLSSYTPLLQWDDLSFSIPDKGATSTTILHNITGTLNSGEVVAIIGPSGSGKSTFLKLLNRLLEPTRGKIQYKGQAIDKIAVTELRRQVAYISQRPYLFPGTVADNLAYGAQLWNLDYDGAEWLEKVDLSPTLLTQQGDNLSGGEQQRLALARSLLLEPSVLLLDEPTSALDIHGTALIENLISSYLHGERAVLWVTHDPKQAKRIAHRIFLMEQGRLLYDLSVEDFFSSNAPEKVKTFLTVREGNY
ncbi:ABC transporter ATP-binding protein [Heliorestis acidaminivorans]|uniref:ABC transporter ATP-binding protein n=1 Tax=Heliorestis acidaminivorans TaxID=553427 RepID=UPI001478A032|nr:ATP-binding cassette domain-containing protein [Heliorestis acidaminivorans]